MARSIRLATLFVEFESNAKGFQRDLRDNERALGRLSDFVRKNTLVAIGGLGAAAAAAGFEASRMAAAFDASARKIAAVVPGATARLNDLKKIANDLAVSKGLSSDQVLGGLSAVARQGVQDLEHLKGRFEVVQKTADATGASFDDVAAGLDQALDVFGLADNDLEKVAARLAAVSEGRFPIEDLFGALQAAARTAKDAGVSFDQVVGRLAVLVSEGKNAKQSAAQLKDELEKGRKSFAALPKLIGSTTDEIARLGERARVAAGGVDRMQTAIGETFLARARATGSAINQYLISPIERLILYLSDPIFTKGALTRNAAVIAAIMNGDGLAAAQLLRGPTKPGSTGHVTGHPGRLFLNSETGNAGAPAIDPALRDQAAQFSDEVRAALVKASDTLVDDLALALGELEKKYREVSAALTSDQRELFRQQFAQLQRDLDAALKAESITQGLTPGLASTTGPGRLPLKNTTEALAEGTKAAADQAERYKREQKEANDEIERSRQKIRQQADAIQRAVRDAVALGEAFGLVDDNLGKVLEGVANVASELSVVAQNGLSVSSVLTIGAGIAGILGGIFGESADAKRDREIREANTQAIHELTKALVGQISGQQATTARGAVGALLGLGATGLGRGKFNATLDIDKVNRALEPFGLNLRDLEEQLKAINPNLKLNTSSTADFAESLRQVQQALDELNFRAFADSFAGQLALLQDQFDLMDVSNPLDQLEALAKLGKGSSPILKELLAGVDLSTQAGRDEAEKRILEAFKKLGLDSKNGGFTAEQLGKLSSEELRDLLKKLEELIDQTNAQNGSQSGGGATTFGAIAGVTEVTGNRLAGILTSADIHLAGIEAAVVDIRDLLAPLVLVNPPSLPASTLVPYTGPTVFEVHVYGAPDDATARGIGATVGTAAAEAFDAKLGARQRKRALGAGKATVVQ